MGNITSFYGTTTPVEQANQENVAADATNLPQVDTTNLPPQVDNSQPQFSKLHPNGNPPDMKDPESSDAVPYWKNKCTTDTDYVWIFSSYFGNGWWFTTPTVNEYVEGLHKKWTAGEPIVYESHKVYDDSSDESSDDSSADDDDLDISLYSVKRFRYDFDKMTQINDNTGTIRRIKRLSINVLKEIEEKMITMTKNNDFVWVYGTRSGKFIAYVPQQQQELSDAHNRYMRVGENNPDDKNNCETLRIMNVNGYEYLIDFLNMTQTNLATNTVRNIKRIPANEVSPSDYSLSRAFNKK
jgi:hypothetical protein